MQPVVADKTPDVKMWRFARERQTAEHFVRQQTLLRHRTVNNVHGGGWSPICNGASTTLVNLIPGVTDPPESGTAIFSTIATARHFCCSPE